VSRHTAGRPGRVLVQVNSLALGGTQLNAVQFAAGLAQRGWSSLLVGPRDTLPSGPSLIDVATEAGVPVDVMERPTTTIGGARDLARRARAWDADLVHVYSSNLERPAYWGPCVLGRRPLVLTVYEMELSDRTHRACPLVVGTGYLLDESVARRGPVALISPPVEIEAAPDSAADSFFVEHDLPPDARRVVLVSRLDEVMKARSVELAMGAIECAARDDIVLVVVGGGDAEARLRAIGDATNARLGRRAIVFTGPARDPRPAYEGADLVIGMGGSAARALSHGRRLVVLGENGWSCAFEPATALELYRFSFWSDAEPHDALEHLASTICRVLDDERGRDDLEQFGRTFAAEHFELERMLDKLESVYEQSGSGRRRAWWYDISLELQALGKVGPFSRSRRPQPTDVALGARIPDVVRQTDRADGRV